MDKSDYDIIYLILCQLLIVLSYSTGMIVSYFSPEVSKIDNTGSVAQKKKHLCAYIKISLFWNKERGGISKIAKYWHSKILIQWGKVREIF